LIDRVFSVREFPFVADADEFDPPRHNLAPSSPKMS
jgi:hypothetical protein